MEAAVGGTWLSSYITDQLYLQMCKGPIIDHPCGKGCSYEGKINKYYLEAAKYAGTISTGNFSNGGKKPIFIINIEDFTPRLQAELLASKESLDSIVTQAAFMILRARHKLIFYEHIENQRFNWELII